VVQAPTVAARGRRSPALLWRERLRSVGTGCNQLIYGSVIGAGAQIATGGQGSPNTPASFPQLAVAGAAENINQAGQQITQKNLNLQPTIEVAPGQKINIFLTKDMILKPYAD